MTAATIPAETVDIPSSMIEAAAKEGHEIIAVLFANRQTPESWDILTKTSDGRYAVCDCAAGALPGKAKGYILGPSMTFASEAEARQELALRLTHAHELRWCGCGQRLRDETGEICRGCAAFEGLF